MPNLTPEREAEIRAIVEGGEWYAFDGADIEACPDHGSAEHDAECALEIMCDDVVEGGVGGDFLSVDYGRLIPMAHVAQTRAGTDEDGEQLYAYELKALPDPLAELWAAYLAARAERDALREQLAARETVPAVTRDAAYALVEAEFRALGIYRAEASCFSGQIALHTSVGSGYGRGLCAAVDSMREALGRAAKKAVE